MTNSKRLMRKANAIVKAIRKAREEQDKQKSDSPSVKFFRAMLRNTGRTVDRVEERQQ